jgi:ATP-binding cassette, subfamily B, bacterial MsbA
MRAPVLLDSLRLYGRLLERVRPHVGLLVASQVALALVAALGPVLPALLTPLLDGTFAAEAQGSRLWVPLALVGVSGLIGVLEYGGNLALATVGARVVRDLRGEMFRHLVRQPAHYYDDTSTGVLISKVTYDAQQTMGAATQCLQVMVKDGLTVIALMAFLLWLDWRLVLVLLALLPALWAAVRAVSARLRRTSHQLQESMGEVTQVVEEAVSAHRVVKIFGGQEHEAGRLEQAARRAAKAMVRMEKAGQANGPLVQFILACGIAVVIWFAAGRAASGALTVGEFASFFTAVTMLVAPLKRLTGVNQHFQRGLAAAESIFALLAARPEEDIGTVELPRVRGEIRFEGVSFHYPHGASMAIDALSMSVPAGSTLALIGASGSGKSTLVGLLTRLYRPGSGRITLDGIDIGQVRLASLRRNLALVSQDVTLFNDTLRNNIAYGSLRGTALADVRRAAEAAFALEFIEALPEGFDTVVGERGVRLSGGQRQRIAIARALLKDAPVLILDEATSALDSESERHIQQALERLQRGRTCVIIAHRLSTIEHADRIAVLEHGRLVEFGTPAELLRADGHYARLRRLQYGGQ